MRPGEQRRGALRQRGYRFGRRARRFGTGASVPSGYGADAAEPDGPDPGLKRWPVVSTWECSRRPALGQVVRNENELEWIGDCVVLFKFTVVVKDDERAFLTRDGRFERLLGPGRFTTSTIRGRLAAEVVKVVRAEIAADKALLLAKTHPEVAGGALRDRAHRRERGRHRVVRRRGQAPRQPERDAGLLEDDHQGRRRSHRRRHGGARRQEAPGQARPVAHAAGRARRGRGARGGPAVRRRPADRAPGRPAGTPSGRWAARSRSRRSTRVRRRSR